MIEAVIAYYEGSARGFNCVYGATVGNLAGGAMSHVTSQRYNAGRVDFGAR
jgi:hypothetical protein